MLNNIYPNNNYSKPNFKASIPIQRYERSISWKDAVEIAKKQPKPNPEWTVVFDAYKSAKTALTNIAEKMGFKFNGNIGELTNNVFETFESGKISETQCFDTIEKINKLGEEYNASSTRLETISNRNRIVDLMDKIFSALCKKLESTAN